MINLNSINKSMYTTFVVSNIENFLLYGFGDTLVSSKRQMQGHFLFKESRRAH